MEGYGTLGMLAMADGWTAFATKEHCQGVTVQAGEQLQAVVLDIDVQKRIVDVSLRCGWMQMAKQYILIYRPFREALVNVQRKKVKGKKHRSGSKVGDQLTARIQLIKQAYLVVLSEDGVMG